MLLCVFVVFSCFSCGNQSHHHHHHNQSSFCPFFFVTPQKDGGVCVDAQCRASPQTPGEAVGDGVATSASGSAVYAAGDVASFPLTLEGSRRVRHEHIQNAR